MAGDKELIYDERVAPAIYKLNEQIRNAIRREGVPDTIACELAGINGYTIRKLKGWKGVAQSVTMLSAIKLLDFLGYELVLVKIHTRKDVMEDPEILTKIKKTRDELAKRTAAKKLKRNGGPRVVVKKTRRPESIDPRIIASRGEIDAAKREDDFLS